LNLRYPLFSLRLPSSCLRLLSCSPVTYILPSTCPLITWNRRQSLRKMWPIKLAFRLFTACRISNMAPHSLETQIEIRNLKQDGDPTKIELTYIENQYTNILYL
jgi:hypothetical protein